MVGYGEKLRFTLSKYDGDQNAISCEVVIADCLTVGTRMDHDICLNNRTLLYETLYIIFSQAPNGDIWIQNYETIHLNSVLIEPGYEVYHLGDKLCVGNVYITLSTILIDYAKNPTAFDFDDMVFQFEAFIDDQKELDDAELELAEIVRTINGIIKKKESVQVKRQTRSNFKAPPIKKRSSLKIDLTYDSE